MAKIRDDRVEHDQSVSKSNMSRSILRLLLTLHYSCFLEVLCHLRNSVTAHMNVKKIFVTDSGK